MSEQTARGVVVTLHGDPHVPEFIPQIDRLTEGSPYRLASVDAVPGGAARCVFVKRDEHLAVGGGNFVDLLYRLQRSFELQGAEREPVGVSA